jgi:hypothetical protein
VDRSYVDFARLNVLHQAGAFFVTRAKSNMDAHRVYSAPTDRSTCIICNQTISLDGNDTSRDYPELLRRIRFKDPESGKTLVFITNNLALPAATICVLYKSRWQVELFFKWIKQHLRIKQFYGTSENTVKTQTWIAVSVLSLFVRVVFFWLFRENEKSRTTNNTANTCLDMMPPISASVPTATSPASLAMVSSSISSVDKVRG